MWLTLLWQNKGLVALAAAILLMLGMVAAIKIQSNRLANAKQKIETVEKERDVAIDAHDRLVKDWERRTAILEQYEQEKKLREAENERLHKTLREALAKNRVWADTLIPADVTRVLQVLPKDDMQRNTTAPSSANASAGIQGQDK